MAGKRAFIGCDVYGNWSRRGETIGNVLEHWLQGDKTRVLKSVEVDTDESLFWKPACNPFRLDVANLSLLSMKQLHDFVSNTTREGNLPSIFRHISKHRYEKDVAYDLHKCQAFPRPTPLE